MPQSLPAVKVLSAACSGDTATIRVEVVGRAEGLCRPIAPAGIWRRPRGEAQPIELHRLVSRAGSEMTFECYGAPASLPAVGETYTLLSWWTPAQLKLAADASRPWRREEFTPRGTSPVDPRNPPVTEPVLSCGWSHEHCVLCWTAISPAADDQHVGYTDGRDWICEPCHCRYVAGGLGKKIGDAC